MDFQNPAATLSRREVLALVGAAGVASVSAACTPAATPESQGWEPDGPLHYATLTEVAALIERGDLSPVELTQRMLDRIDAVDTRLHSYVTIMAEQALGAARAAEREIAAGQYRGPLHGIPIAVKDLCYTKGVKTMGGLAVLADFVPDYDATVVAKLAAAGAVLLGKLALTEGAMGGYHRSFKIPVNPWRAGYWTGASSSGSGVATAAGLCFASLGTDTGGSIRFPSMANGTVGLKPTYGRVSRYGVLPLAETLDHVGPMTRSVADAAVVLQAIAGHDPADSTSLQDPVGNIVETLQGGVAGVRIGWDGDYAGAGVDANLMTAIKAALAQLESQGAEIVAVKMPAFAETEQDTWFTICAFEAHVAHRDHYPSRADEYGAYFRNFLDLGAAVTAEAYEEAGRRRAAYNEQLRAVLDSVDAVACPAGGAPFEVSEEVLYSGLAEFAPLMREVSMRFTIPADFAGTPAIVVPCGVSPGSVPYSIQFLGAHLSEPALCRIGHAYQQATEWHKRHPSI